MLKHVTLALNAIDSETWTHHEVQDIRAFLSEQFAEWPDHAHIYHKHVSTLTDVTPVNESDVEALGEMEGPFYVVVYPGDPLTILYAAVAVIFVGAVVLSALMKVPNAAARNDQTTSPNNELSERTNKPRLNGRIPDVYGTVRSTPDLIALPYKIFIDQKEVEYAYMCIGRGNYEISDIRDDKTLSSNISGTSVEIYGPNTSPNSGAPQLRIGNPINTKVLNVVRSNAVNGQVLRSPNDQSIRADKNIKFAPPNYIVAEGDGADKIDFTKEFAVGNTITVANATIYNGGYSNLIPINASNLGYFRFPIASEETPPEYIVGKQIEILAGLFSNSGTGGFLTSVYDLTGTYIIKTVEAVIFNDENYCKVTLDNPQLVNAGWAKANESNRSTVAINIEGGEEVANLNGNYQIESITKSSISLVMPQNVNPYWNGLQKTVGMSPIISITDEKWVGPFIVGNSTTDQLFANFVATNGLYKDDGKNQTEVNVTIQVEVTPVNNIGQAIGSAKVFSIGVEGSNKYKNTRAATLKAELGFTGPFSIRAKRLTLTDLKFEGTVVDEIKWRDIYGVSSVSNLNFGNVTTVQSVTYATDGALAVKDRKLNMIVTRMIPLRISGSTFTSNLYATNKVDEIIAAICLDPRIGNRNANEIDFDSIYNSINSVRNYFGTYLAAEFCYTFDTNNLSFEETITSITSSVFCKAYRRGNIFKLNFEKETENSTLLFNHQNKLPSSETRTVRFGNDENYDGVFFQYVSPEDDAIVTLYIPEDQTAINPKEIESLGIRNKVQAYFQAWRLWNKIRFQNVIVEFKATHEADLLVTNDRILVADNTRSETQDGQVESQNGLLLKLSHSVTMTIGKSYSLFIQYADETIESIPVTPGPLIDEVVLSRAPRIPLALDDDLYAKTTFVLVGNNDIGENAFLVSEKSPQGNMTSTVRAVNYDARYYKNDTDLINNVIDGNGNYV